MTTAVRRAAQETMEKNMPRIVSHSEKERIMRDAITDALRRFHRNSCYPEAMQGEIEIAVAEIVNAIHASWF